MRKSLANRFRQEHENAQAEEQEETVQARDMPRKQTRQPTLRPRKNDPRNYEKPDPKNH